MIDFPSPAVSIVGRHNSGKTTLIEKLIAELVGRGFDVGSVKHHSHVGFDIDIPGKDSWRHRHAGASETVIAAPGQMARIKTTEGELECADIVASMPGHDVVIVEGYRKSGLPTIEIMRAGNAADARTAEVFAEGARKGWALGTDFTQFGRNAIPHVNDADAPEPAEAPKLTASEEAEFARQYPNRTDISNKMPTASTVAVVTDIPQAAQAADVYGIPAFDIDDVSALADFVEQAFARPRVSLVIQAGGESRRMGRSKATVPFCGRPLICRMVERLSPVADELIITTNEPENLAFLHTQYPNLHIQLVCDAVEERGALPGLYTALRARRANPYVAVVACDMVRSPARLRWWLKGRDDGGRARIVVVPANKHGFEPFHAVYRRMGCLPAVRAALDRGDKRAQIFFDQVNVCEFPQEKVLAAEPRGGCFINANTPAELAALERIVQDQTEG